MPQVPTQAQTPLGVMAEAGVGKEGEEGKARWGVQVADGKREQVRNHVRCLSSSLSTAIETLPLLPLSHIK